MDMFDFAGMLFGRAGTSQPHSVTASGAAASADGVASITLDADVTPAEDVGEDADQTIIDLPTSPDVDEGDELIVTLVGDGPLKTPVVTANPGSGDRQNERIHAIEADYVKATTLEADVAEIGFLKADSATIADLQADTAKVHDLTAEQLTAATGYVGELQAGSVSAQDIVAGKATVGELVTDHVSVSDFEAEQASIDSLQAATADIDTIRANSAKVQNLTAAQLEADHATIGTLDTTYMHADMANADVAWIQNGTIKDGSIVSAMINDVSANKLTAGTINGSVINVTNLNADNITAGTINGQRIGEGSLSLSKLEEDVYTETEVNNIVDGLNDRIDGAIETHTGTAVPTLNNSPASSWNTTKLRDEHVGDVYYVVNSQSQQNGYCYRFTKSGSTYSWQLIKDSDVTAALSRLTTAEGKITSFDSDISTLKTDTGTLTTKTTSLETRMSDAESDILDKVDTTTFNSLEDTVDGHTQTISQHTTAISNKADSSTVTAVTNRVSKNEQDISGINTTIGELQDTVETKADGSTVSTISNKLNTVSDTVDGHTQTLTSVQNTLSTKADSSTVSTLTTKVNNVSDTVDGHTQTISGQSTILSNNGLTSSTNITNRVSSVEQDLSGYKTTVSETYATQTALATTNGNVTAAQTAADNAQTTANTANNKQVAFSATSSTGATTAAKVATCSNFPALAAGATVTVRFSAANTSTGAVTLNVNSTGAKTVYVNGSATSSSNQLLWGANANITFTYDGTYWRVDSEPRTWYGTGTVAAATAAKTATINEVVICKGTTVVLNMTYENTNTSATLNVTSTGAKNIYYGTTTTRPTTANGYGWGAGSTVSLTFDGAYWRIGDTTALTRLTAAESTISSHTTSISQNANAIALKADSSTTYTKTDVDGLISTEVTNRNAAITAKANEITSSVSETYATKTAVNGKADASDVSALAGRVSTAESNITQNAEAIALRATKTETYQIAQPNLSPYFSSSPYNRTANSYWYGMGANSNYTFTDMGDGWMHVQCTNSGSSVIRVDWYPIKCPSVVAGQPYTWLAEVRNNHSTKHSSAKGSDFYLVQTNNNQFWGQKAIKTLNEVQDGVFANTSVTIDIGLAGETVEMRKVQNSETASDGHWTNNDEASVVGLACWTFRCAANSTLDYEVRLSLYDGEYTGPYKSYSGTQLYASQAELKVTNDSISTKVDKNGVISSINQSAESVSINANKINLQGAVTISDLSSDAQSATLNSNISVGGRNWLLDTGTFNDWVSGTGITFSNGVATFPSRSSLWWASIRHFTIPAADFFGNTWTFSFDYRSDDFSDTSGNRYIQVNLEASASYNASDRTKYRALNSSNISGAANTWVPTTEWQKGSVTFTAADESFLSVGSGDVNYVGITIWSYTLNSFQVRRMKLEKGNTATDWSPAPEDAAKTATSYVTEITGQNGIMVHPSTDDDTGVRITSDVDIMRDGNSVLNVGTQGDTTSTDAGVTIYDGTASKNVVARFDSDEVSLGANSEASTIDMCGGVFTFEVDNSDPTKPMASIRVNANADGVTAIPTLRLTAGTGTDQYGFDIAGIGSAQYPISVVAGNRNVVNMGGLGLQTYAIDLAGIGGGGTISAYDGVYEVTSTGTNFWSTVPGTVLWSGTYFMTASHTANLAYNVSTCRSGIVLHFQPYTSSTTQNYYHQYCFVPKTAAANYSGMVHNFTLCNSGFAKVGMKALRIYDNRIVGDDSNDDTGTASGITFDNKYWVMTQVIAV